MAGSVGVQNVEMHLDSAHRQGLLPAAEALVSALKDIDIDANEVPINVANTNVQAIHILIGPKR
jgi:hypothetical protein